MNNNLPTIQNAQKIITQARPKFTGSLKFEIESDFAMMSLRKNDYVLKTALNNPESLLEAITSVARIGISLNPALAHAYLVPRKIKGQPAIVLDISYRGLCRIAVDSNCVRFVQAIIVRRSDDFKKVGIDKEPIHTYDPMKSDDERGEITGVYCVAKTIHGDYLTEVMNIGQIENIMKRSEAYKSNSGPWKTDFEEMAKKTVIKRASKLWPVGDGKFHQAVESINQHEGIDFEQEKKSRAINEDELAHLRELCSMVENGEKRALDYVYILNGKDVVYQELEQLTETDYIKVRDQINLIISKQEN